MIKRQGIVIISAALILMGHIIHKGYLNYLIFHPMDQPDITVSYMAIGMLSLGWLGVFLELRDNPVAMIGGALVLASQLCLMVNDIKRLDIKPEILMGLQIVGWLVFSGAVPYSGTPPTTGQRICSLSLGAFMSALIFIGLPMSERLGSVYSPVLVLMMLCWVMWARYMRLVKR